MALLIVDDEESNRDMLARRLRRQGFDVVLAEDGPPSAGLDPDPGARHGASGYPHAQY